jgi:hypothetical protein
LRFLTLSKEVGEALECVAETLADGVVEENELKATIPKLEDVIQECASLNTCWKTSAKRERKRQTADQQENTDSP